MEFLLHCEYCFPEKYDYGSDVKVNRLQAENPLFNRLITQSLVIILSQFEIPFL